MKRQEVAAKLASLLPAPAGLQDIGFFLKPLYLKEAYTIPLQTNTRTLDV